MLVDKSFIAFDLIDMSIRIDYLALFQNDLFIRETET